MTYRSLSVQCERRIVGVVWKLAAIVQNNSELMLDLVYNISFNSFYYCSKKHRCVFFTQTDAVFFMWCGPSNYATVSMRYCCIEFHSLLSYWPFWTKHCSIPALPLPHSELVVSKTGDGSITFVSSPDTCGYSGAGDCVGRWGRSSGGGGRWESWAYLIHLST